MNDGTEGPDGRRLSTRWPGRRGGASGPTARDAGGDGRLRLVVAAAALCAAVLAPAVTSHAATRAAAPAPLHTASRPAPADVETTDDDPAQGSQLALDVEAGVGGFGVPAGPIIVHATVTADTLIDGRIEATTESSPIAVRQQIEVPAGTTKEYWFVLPQSFDQPRATVRVIDGDELVEQARAGVNIDEGAELVGLLPELAARSGSLPTQETLNGGLGDAHIDELPVEVMRLGPMALRAYTVAVAGAGDLVALDADERDSLLAWVSMGGTLLLDDGGDTAALPDEWQPGRAGYATAGLGEIRLIDGAGARGEWAGVIPPTSRMFDEPFSAGTEMTVGPQEDLARRAGITLPSVVPLSLGLGAYALVIGPALYLLLRRMRRLTLGWVVIPVGAALVTVAIVVIEGDSLTGDTTAATFIQTSPGVAFGFTNVLSFADSGGSVDLDIAPTSTLDSGGAMWFGDPADLGQIVLERAGDGTQVASADVEASQASVTTVAGLAEPLAFSTTATVDDDGVLTGRVTNDTDVTMHDVAVFSPTSQALLGNVGPGESAMWRLDPIGEQVFMGNSRGANLWRLGFDDMGRDRQRRPGQLAEIGIWGQVSMSLDYFPSATVRVVGWTDELASGVSPDSASTVTAVSAVQPISGGTVSAATAARSIVRGSDMVPGQSQVYRFLLRPGADTGDLALEGFDVPFGQGGRLNFDGELETWTGNRWVELPRRGDRYTLPDEAVIDGVVLVRSTLMSGDGFGVLPVLSGSDG